MTYRVIQWATGGAGKAAIEGIARHPELELATAMHCVNSVPCVCRADPGIMTYLDLPLIAGRAAPALA